MIKLCPCLLILVAIINFCYSEELYTIEGQITPSDELPIAISLPKHYQLDTRILLDGGEFVGFIREDGSFTVPNVPSGTYLLEAIHPVIAFEQVRVDINSKGKFRARKVNNLQNSQVVQLAYPLRVKPIMKYQYFQQREQWRVTDFIFSPMVLMMFLPLVLLMILPKFMNDPETRKEMEEFNNSMKYEMPEISEIFTNMLSGADKKKPIKAVKKKQN